jgi:hypothetical protein
MKANVLVLFRPLLALRRISVEKYKAHDPADVHETWRPSILRADT